MPDRNALLAVLDESRQFVSRDDNDFSYSSWESTTDAVDEITRLMNEIRAGRMPHLSRISILFAPTGPMQEVATDSGWGDEFVDLADRFDAAAETQDLSCSCNTPEATEFETVRQIGLNSEHLDSEIVRCGKCGQYWVIARYEDEAFSSSGRWFRGAVPSGVAADLAAESVRNLWETMPQYFVGGSYYNGFARQTHGPIHL